MDASARPEGQPGPSDATLLSAVADGDRAAFEELYARHAAWLVVRLTRRCADPGLVDEVVQDIFVAVWRSAHRWDGRGEVGAWVWGIAIRRLVDGIRAKPRTLLGLVREDAADLTSHRSSAPPAGSVASAEDAVLLGVQYGDLGGALDRLSPELRAVVQAIVLDGLTTREAAKLLGIPAGTVKTRMMRARAALREELA